MAEPQSSTAEAELWWLGLLLEAIGTLFCAAGKICWRYAATSTNNWYYCAGAVLTMGLYPMLDSLAYSFASQSLLGVSSGLVVLWSTALAPPLLGERLTVSRATGAAVVVVGTVCVALSGSHGNMTERSPAQLIRLLLSPSACLYYTGFLLWAACCASLRAAMLTDERRALVLAVGAGSLSGNMFTIKAGMTLLRCLFDTSCEHRADEPGALLADGIILLVLSAAVHGVALTLFALALRRGEALQMVRAAAVRTRTAPTPRDTRTHSARAAVAGTRHWHTLLAAAGGALRRHIHLLERALRRDGPSRVLDPRTARRRALRMQPAHRGSRSWPAREMAECSC